MMTKADAIALLGGERASQAEVARAIGVTRAAVANWPDVLPARVVDRVQAALARKYLPAHLLTVPTVTSK